MIEKEYKLLITKEEYELLIKKMKFQTIYSQVNHYYDTSTSDFLKNNISFRIREKKGKKSIQVKSGREEGKLHIKNEMEFSINTIPSNISRTDFSDVFKCLPNYVDNLWYLGHLTTMRSELKKGNSVICLDKNYYLGVIDYELEIEFTDDGEDALCLLNLLELQLRGKTLGKFKRFSQLLSKGKINE
jgi:uncharacterized protein YjbK